MSCLFAGNCGMYVCNVNVGLYISPMCDITQLCVYKMSGILFVICLASFLFLINTLFLSWAVHIYNYIKHG